MQSPGGCVGVGVAGASVVGTAVGAAVGDGLGAGVGGNVRMASTLAQTQLVPV